MATLLLLRAAGSVAGRCDASCYDATTGPDHCTCVCGGINHAAGLEQAIDNTGRLNPQRIVQTAAGRGINVYRPPIQLPLF
ncbi:hypothetical protein [Thermomonospora cellulosilytica]|uniref:Uncharacterized protein n=1 Tax=Thermomonospora cellulosilytica TaxID=1411118 RepID=A0A7W3N1V8_9ACTN|nr:hypothetical protein [Thermomonospora cellulosilytica]MBA9005996.1 hypothetical protein [Thermomonospora cellulosilytica]